MMGVNHLSTFSPDTLGKGHPEYTNEIGTIPKTHLRLPPSPSCLTLCVDTPAFVHGVVLTPLCIAQSEGGCAPREGGLHDLKLMLTADPQSSV